MSDSGLSLDVSELSVSIGGQTLLHKIDFHLPAGGRLGLIGGSGSGKTLTALAIAGLLPEDAEVSGSILLGGTELVGMPEQQLASVRGDLIGMVFQEPRTALNPMRRLGRQMTEALAQHYTLSRAERDVAARTLAAQVGLDDPERIVRAYPHEVSGGQRQRAAIAAAISARPGLLLADEPTTALDVTVQRGVLALLRTLSADEGRSLIFISHDLAVIASASDHLLVMHEGRIIERGAVSAILDAPQHPVTRALIAAATPNTPRDAAAEVPQPRPGHAQEEPA